MGGLGGKGKKGGGFVCLVASFSRPQDAFFNNNNKHHYVTLSILLFIYVYIFIPISIIILMPVPVPVPMPAAGTKAGVRMGVLEEAAGRGGAGRRAEEGCEGLRINFYMLLWSFFGGGI